MKVFFIVGLFEVDDICWVELFCFSGVFCCDIKVKRGIVYVIDNDFLVFGVVVGLLVNVCFDDVVVVEEGYFVVRFDLYFIVSVFGEDREGGYVKMEFVSFGEFVCEVCCKYVEGVCRDSSL